MENVPSTDQSGMYIEIFTRFIKALRQIIHSNPITPLPNSKASTELSRLDDLHKQGLINSYDLGGILLETAFDHIFAFSRMIDEPALSIPPWSSTRIIIESSAVSVWFMDNKADVLERIKRGYAYRYSGMIEQLKLGKLTSDQQAIDYLTQRIEELERETILMEIQPLRDKNGKRTGLGRPMPSYTEIIREQTKNEPLYRIFSALIHGHSWALTQTCFSQIQRDDRVILEKKLHPSSICYLSMIITNTIFKPMISKAIYFGWDIKAIASLYISTRREMIKIYNPL